MLTIFGNGDFFFFFFFYSFACKLCRFGGRVVGGRGVSFIMWGQDYLAIIVLCVYHNVQICTVCAIMYRSALVCESVCMCVCVCVFGGAHAQH